MLPIIFGSAKHQALLLRIAREGAVRIKPRAEEYHLRLLRCGLVSVRITRGSHLVALDPRHPAASLVRRVLRELVQRNGECIASVPKGLSDNGVHRMDLVRPLGHLSPHVFRILHQVVLAAHSVEEKAVREDLVDVWPESVFSNLRQLVKDGVLVKTREGRVALAPATPSSLPKLIVALAELLAASDPRVLNRLIARGPRPRCWVRAADGAPRLFGSDIRLRNMMALAKHGPMLHRELRKLTGAWHLHRESSGEAPFGRGSLVRTWDSPHGLAVMLDRDHPVALPLKQLLLQLERTYPLPPHVALFAPPKPPARRTWNGDRYALFGGPIATSILLTIAVLGWTFLELCIAFATGYTPPVVKKPLRRLEDEGVLHSDEPRRPGFHVRVLKIAEAFPAKAELEAVLRAYLRAWPEVSDGVHSAMHAFTPRTIAHLRQRGLWPYK